MALRLGWTDCHTVSYFRVFKCLPFHYFWPTAMTRGSVTNFDMLFLVMGLISLVDEIKFILISSSHFLHKLYADERTCCVQIVDNEAKYAK